MTNSVEPAVLVAGDVTVDWLLATPSSDMARLVDQASTWGSGIGARAISQAGGAALLGELIASRMPSSRAEVMTPRIDQSALSSPSCPVYTRTYTSWTPFVDQKTGGRSWRISEFWGTDGAASHQREEVFPGPVAARLLVFDDAGLGFRERDAEWRPMLAANPNSPCLLKMSSSLGCGSLWEQVSKSHADRLTVVVSSSDLRASDEGHVGVALSWEQLLTETVACVGAHSIGRAFRTVVLFGVSGAVIVERGGATTLVYDPRNLENDWEREHPGSMMGYATCVTAALAEVLGVRGCDGAGVARAVAQGLSAARQLHLVGYSESGDDQQRTIGFPYVQVASALDAPTDVFATYDTTAGFDEGFSILRDRIGQTAPAVAKKIVIDGASAALANVPNERIGAWSSVDRREIEGMRSVRNILQQYIAQWRCGRPMPRPISIAVFGPPGAGKSFAIKQLAKELAPSDLVAAEFNLSQFESAAELADAFHQVRDAGLRRSLPLVFFDEFDSALEGVRLGWLRHFLAPMQDGAFRESGMFHPIGPAIFVFAGGTTATLNEFAQDGEPGWARSVKRPDFLSRLRGYVDIMGPNPVSEQDDMSVIRRAFLLRAVLESKLPTIFDGNKAAVDPRLVEAFLGVSRFKHGSRSIEALVDMSSLDGKASFTRSCLPAEHQLGLHVEPEEFVALLA